MATLIKKPIISEKAFSLAGEGVYVFLVARSANKQAIASEIKKRFKVDVVDVRIINIPGKVKRVGRKFGTRSDIKKALVKVKKGQQIAIFETETKKDKKAVKKESAKQESAPEAKKAVPTLPTGQAGGRQAKVKSQNDKDKNKKQTLSS